MKYPYAVKVNGKWYEPNHEVPGTAKKQAVSESANQRDIPLVKEVRDAAETDAIISADKAVPVEDVPKKRGRKSNK